MGQLRRRTFAAGSADDDDSGIDSDPELRGLPEQVRIIGSLMGQLALDPSEGMPPLISMPHQSLAHIWHASFAAELAWSRARPAYTPMANAYLRFSSVRRGAAELEAASLMELRSELRLCGYDESVASSGFLEPDRNLYRGRNFNQGRGSSDFFEDTLSEIFRDHYNQWLPRFSRSQGVQIHEGYHSGIRRHAVNLRVLNRRNSDVAARFPHDMHVSPKVPTKRQIRETRAFLVALPLNFLKTAVRLHCRDLWRDSNFNTRR
jgi:hypothetical protein